MLCVWQALFCVQIREQSGANVKRCTFVPMMAGYRYKESCSHEGFQAYCNPATEPILFTLTSDITLHRVTTGFRLQKESDDADYELLASYVNPAELVAFATEQPIPELNFWLCSCDKACTGKRLTSSDLSFWCLYICRKRLKPSYANLIPPNSASSRKHNRQKKRRREQRRGKEKEEKRRIQKQRRRVASERLLYKQTKIRDEWSAEDQKIVLVTRRQLPFRYQSHQRKIQILTMWIKILARSTNSAV